MDFLNNIENLVIDFDELVKTFEFLSEYFDNKINEDYSYLIKSNLELYQELKSFCNLFNLLGHSLEDLHNNFQNEIDLYYKELG